MVARLRLKCYDKSYLDISHSTRLHIKTALYSKIFFNQNYIFVFYASLKPIQKSIHLFSIEVTFI